jgi:hypothetical protein
MHLAPKPLEYMVDVPIQFEPINSIQYQNQYFYRGFWVDAYELAKKLQFNLSILYVFSQLRQSPNWEG